MTLTDNKDVAEEEMMKALSMEKSIYEGKKEVKELFDFVKTNSEDLTACEMEREIFKRVMLIGLSGMKCYFAKRGTGDAGSEFESDDGTVLHKESGLRCRCYFSVFGKISVPRAYYRCDGKPGIMPPDAEVDFPEHCYSCLLQEWMNLLSIRNSFKESEITLARLPGLNVSSSRFEVVNRDSSRNYDGFYEEKELRPAESEGEIQVLGFDGKGVPVIKKEAAKLKSRRGKGEKRQKKKEAMAGVSYTADKNERTAEEVAENLIYPEKARKKREEEKKEGTELPRTPKARNIRRLASLERTKEDVVGEIADDCKKRNPDNIRSLVVVMDGALALWGLVAKTLIGTDYVGILDIIHVVEYLWKAGNALHGENNSKSQKWVYNQLLSILQGKVGRVIGGLKQTLKKRKLSKRKREALKEVIRYFENHRKRMRYDEYPEAGFPIGSGVVESTCGHTVRDRTEGSGRRWSIKGAESTLLLRSVYTSGDWDAYRDSHMKLERKRLYSGTLKALGIADGYDEGIQFEKAA